MRKKAIYWVGITAMTFAFRASAETTVGVIKVSSNPPGASVYIAGKEYGPTPVFIELAAGTHKAMVSLDGYPPKTSLLSVFPGRVSYARVKFKGAHPAAIRVHNTKREGGPDAGPGTVNVATDPPGLNVYMNGKLVPQVTPVSFDIWAGPYELAIAQEGQMLAKRTVFVRAGRTLDLIFEIKHRRQIDQEDPWN